MLSRAILQLGAIMTVYRKDTIYDNLVPIKYSLDTAMNNIRESVHDLHKDGFNVKETAESILSALGNYDVNFICDISQNADKEVKYAFITILKEAVTNIEKYCNGNKVRVVISELEEYYQMLIQDNGVVLGWNGLYIGAQDGSVELTAKNGLVMYDDDVTNPNRVARFKLGRFEQTTNNYSYGLRLYNANAQETLVTRDDGELWLQRELTVGQSNAQVGLSGLPASGQGESPIRFWAGVSSG